MSQVPIPSPGGHLPAKGGMVLLTDHLISQRQKNNVEKSVTNASLSCNFFRRSLLTLLSEVGHFPLCSIVLCSRSHNTLFGNKNSRLTHVGPIRFPVRL